MKKLFICTALIVGLGACSTEKSMETKLIGNIDTTQEPGVDFFQYSTDHMPFGIFPLVFY